jgi:hypothetical protein
MRNVAARAYPRDPGPLRRAKGSNMTSGSEWYHGPVPGASFVLPNGAA